MKRFLFLTIFLLITGNLLLKAQPEQNIYSSKVVHPTVIRTGTFLGITPPLRDIKNIKQNYVEIIAEKEEYERELNKGLAIRNYPYYTPSGPDPVWQKFMPQTKATTNLILNFDGQSSSYYPSDCNGAVGINYFMQGVNATYAIYNKNTGTQVVGPTAFNTLFSGVPGSSNNDGDIIVLFDDNASRWFAAEFDISDANNLMLIAVSVTDDPTGLV